MDAGTSKALMKSICAELARGNSRPLIDALADDFCWIVSGTSTWSKTYRVGLIEVVASFGDDG
jgi:ketosteroid isomerase-like protein